MGRPNSTTLALTARPGRSYRLHMENGGSKRLSRVITRDTVIAMVHPLLVATLAIGIGFPRVFNLNVWDFISTGLLGPASN